jgi:hypothetical protein
MKYADIQDQCEGAMMDALDAAWAEISELKCKAGDEKELVGDGFDEDIYDMAIIDALGVIERLGGMAPSAREKS